MANLCLQLLRENSCSSGAYCANFNSFVANLCENIKKVLDRGLHFDKMIVNEIACKKLKIRPREESATLNISSIQ